MMKSISVPSIIKILTLKLNLVIFCFYHSICFGQVHVLYDKNDLRTIFIDTSQLKNEDCIFDKNYIGQLTSIQISKNENRDLALLALTDKKGETRLEFFDIDYTDNSSFELLLDHSDDRKIVSSEYFCLNNFKIVMLHNELSFYYLDDRDGMYILFMKIS